MQGIECSRLGTATESSSKRRFKPRGRLNRTKSQCQPCQRVIANEEPLPETLRIQGTIVNTSKKRTLRQLCAFSMNQSLINITHRSPRALAGTSHTTRECARQQITKFIFADSDKKTRSHVRRVSYTHNIFQKPESMQRPCAELQPLSQS